MKIYYNIIGTELITNLIIACIILHCTIAQRESCINEECSLESDVCYKNQCYEVVGDCDNEKKCEHEDSRCIDTVKKNNICIWLKTPKKDDVTVMPTTTISHITVSPEFQCHDNISDCLRYYFLCKNKIYEPLMKSLCQLTCGHCTSSSTIIPKTCQDKAASGKPSDCPSLSYLCNDPFYIELMKDQCQKTCGFCDPQILPTSSICEDKMGANGKSNCKDVQHLCSVRLYKLLMSIQCPRTCHLC